MATLQLIFDLLARDLASSKFKDVGDAADNAGKKGHGAGTAISSGMKLAAGALLGGGLIAGFTSLYQAAAESAKITALTEQVIKSTGGAAQVTADQVGDLVTAISNKTGVDDEAIQSGANLLLTFTNLRNQAGEGNDIFTQTTQIMTDMSVALGTDASGSAIQLGKALNDPIKGITALSKIGVSFTEQQKEQIKTFVEAGDIMSAQKIILEELGREFGGAAEAAATPLDKLKVTVGNLQEEIGAYLIPVVDKIATFFMEELLPAAKDVGGVIGDVVGPVFRALVPVFKEVFEVVGAVARAFGDLPGPVQASYLALGALLLLWGPLKVMLAGLFTSLVLTVSTMLSAATAAGGFRAAMAGLLLGISPVMLAIGAAVLLIPSLVKGFQSIWTASDAAKRAQQSFAQALRESNGAIDANVRASAAKAAEDSGLLEVAQRSGASLRDVTAAILGNAGAYDRVTAAIQGHTNANAGNRPVVEENRQAILSLDELIPTIGRTADEQGRLAEATGGTGEAMAAVTEVTPPWITALESAATAAASARQSTDDFKMALDLLTGASVSMIEVEIAYERALEAGKTAMEGMNGAVLEGAGDLNEQSTAGQAAAETLFRVRDSGNQLIATMIAQGGTTDDVTAKDAELRESFIRTANQMGITGADADLLADDILGIPGERETKITADTKAATDAANSFQGLIDRLHGRTVEVKVVASDTAGTLAGYFKAFDGGGYTGAGRKSELAGLVHAGEYVLTKDQTSRLGIDAIEAFANGVTLPGYVDGGLVSIISNVNDAAARASIAALARAMSGGGGAAGGGALGGGWSSIFNAVKAVIPQARANSTYRPGDPGYHGRGKAVDFGFGSGPGGAGSAGLASINRLLHDRWGRSLAELIYDGIGDDRDDLKNGRSLNYGKVTSAAHRNHVHAAVYDSGGLLPAGLTMAYNGSGGPETVRTAAQESALAPQVNVRVFIGEQELTHIARVEATNVITGLVTGAASGVSYGGPAR